jgi:parallel beta helix pectate lyase-like protein
VEDIMRKIAFAMSVLGTAAPLLYAAPAHAQATRTWVSGVGTDGGPCSRTAPCKTFAFAISVTAINGIINCIDAGAYGAVTITKSVTIDCHENLAGVLASGTTGVTINIAAGNVNDPLRTVRLRNLNIDGTGLVGQVGTRTGINGIRILSAAIVYLDDMQVSDFTQNGLLDDRTTGGRLHIRNSTFRNNAITGVVVNPSSGTTRIDVDIDGLMAVGNSTGLTAADGVRMQVKRSVIANNSTNGVDAEGATTEMNVDDSAISNNGTGLFTASSGVLRVSNSDVSHNTTRASGAWVSFGNNRALGNTNPGTAPTPAGVASTDLGQI